jgi:hypothetical protein
MRHLERRQHFLRDHVEKGDIEMRYIDTERQLADVFTKLLDASCFAALQGRNWCLPSLWLGLRGSLCSILYICIFLLFYCIFFIFTEVNPVSPIILACIWLIMLVIMLG